MGLASGPGIDQDPRVTCGLPASSGIVTLTTDFGTADGYAGAVKGVILSGAPRVAVVDVSHEIAGGDVTGAAFCVRAAAGTFPPGTVHVAVVDPGVGSERRPVILVSGGQIFVGPDNGIFALAAPAPLCAHVIDVPALAAGRPVSSTFHGRDVFAPAAAALASERALAALGEAIDPASLVGLGIDLAWSEEDGRALGRIVHVDRFGNLVTSLPADLARRASRREGRAGPHAVLAGPGFYDAIPRGRAAFIPGSLGLMEICVRADSAARILGIGPGEQVVMHVEPGP